jgi:hypothetical protein
MKWGKENQTMTTVEELNKGIEVIRAVGECIKMAGEIPSGHLYAALMGKMSLESYLEIIGVLKSAGMVEEKSYLLIWKGGE